MLNISFVTDVELWTGRGEIHLSPSPSLLFFFFKPKVFAQQDSLCHISFKWQRFPSFFTCDSRANSLLSNIFSVSLFRISCFSGGSSFHFLGISAGPDIKKSRAFEEQSSGLTYFPHCWFKMNLCLNCMQTLVRNRNCTLWSLARKVLSDICAHAGTKPKSMQTQALVRWSSCLICQVVVDY